MIYRNILVAAFVTAMVVLCAAGQEKGAREFVGGKWVRVAPPKPGTPAGDLAVIRRHVKQGQDKKAIKAVKKFLKAYPRHKSAEEAMMLAGRAEMNRRRYYQAFEWYEKQLVRFPAGTYSERALRREFDIAERFLGGEKRVVLKIFRISAEDEGLEILSRIAGHAPGSAIAEKAMLRIADHQFSKSRYIEAADAYDRFLQLFGKSAKAPYAALQAARSIYASHHGVQFDETPLIEAELRFRNFASQYPNEARKAKVSSILKQISDARAKKLYDTARFYERTDRSKAAVFYYRRLAKEYPKSIWARQGRENLVRLGAGPRKARRVTTLPARRFKPVSRTRPRPRTMPVPRRRVVRPTVDTTPMNLEDMTESSKQAGKKK